jgi:hypothetical protein
VATITNQQRGLLCFVDFIEQGLRVSEYWKLRAHRAPAGKLRGFVASDPMCLFATTRSDATRAIQLVRVGELIGETVLVTAAIEARVALPIYAAKQSGARIDSLLGFDRHRIN